mgnify:CR=1 FL=1
MRCASAQHDSAVISLNHDVVKTGRNAHGSCHGDRSEARCSGCDLRRRSEFNNQISGAARGRVPPAGDVVAGADVLLQVVLAAAGAHSAVVH